MDIQNYFVFIKKSNAVYERYCQSVILDWNLNGTSFQTLMFLANNPQYNTARDLCKMRGIKTGIASVAIEQLIQMGYLERKTDPADRRVQRLYVTENASELVRQGREVQNEFAQMVSGALDEEERELYFRMNDKIMKRIEELEKEI